MDRQLSFENLTAKNAAAAATIPLQVNPSVPAAIAPRLKHQAQAIYAALKRGPLWTRDLRAMAAQYNARIRELREWLADSGQTIDMTAKGRDGNNRYELRPFAGSRYEAELMKRQSKGNRR